MVRRRDSSVSSIADIFRANIVDVSKESMIIALTGSLSKMNAFIELLEDFNITEVARTGITGLARGSADLKRCNNSLEYPENFYNIKHIYMEVV